MRQALTYVQSRLTAPQRPPDSTGGTRFEEDLNAVFCVLSVFGWIWDFQAGQTVRTVVRVHKGPKIITKTVQYNVFVSLCPNHNRTWSKLSVNHV